MPIYANKSETGAADIIFFQQKMSNRYQSNYNKKQKKNKTKQKSGKNLYAFSQEKRKTKTLVQVDSPPCTY